MALPGLASSFRPSSPPLSFHVLPSSSSSSSSSSSPALLLLSSRRVSRFRKTFVASNGGTNGKRLLLGRAASTKAQQCEEECGGSDSQFVEVIAIGSRKDAVLDFCVDSPFSSKNSIRYWNSMMKDSTKVHLQQRFLNKEDATPSTMEAMLFPQSQPKATILIASAGYGLDHTRAIEILKSIRSVNGYAVAIILRPFSFEGQRRKDEVNHLVGTLKEHTNFCIDINTDMLLKKDVVTLDGALKTANDAVLLAINAISVLAADSHKTYLAVSRSKMRELNVAEGFEVLKCYKEAKIGFGTGYNIRTSIIQAIYQCPFLSYGVKDLNGVVLCLLASSDVNESVNSHAFLDNFRQVTGYEGEVVLSITHEPNLEANMLVTTVITLGSARPQNPQKNNLLSRLAQHFPFVFNLLRNQRESNSSQAEDSPGSASMEDMHSMDFNEDEMQVGRIREGSDINHEEMHAFSKGNPNEILVSSHSESEQINEGELEGDFETSVFDGQVPEVTPAFQREPLNTWSFGPGYVAAQEWAKERAENAAASSILNNLSIFHFPVGVRPSGELQYSLNISNADKHVKEEMENNSVAQTLADSRIPSRSDLTDVGFGAVKDFYDAASSVLKRKEADIPKKQGVLSVRAASMLEAERDSPKKWNPIVEMQYRGGFYRGRCQGGLPEGKGRLVLGDGSVYDGMWRYGKRSGSGTFYFSNGDVFQGSWRDDVMHGKGWFYFHTGDRWFANFWKGKANGEGRFYTKSGEVFFGQFKDGWRHGQFLCIEVDGQRHVETWDEGVLISCQQLGSNS
ncbi:hypothetical protein CDL15_Pgr020995 [Punica granatum]|uniref:Protein ACCUMULATION AND REPLICATION OF CHLOROPLASTS 3 n=1 Tax=Punica granatum TaxID=22663 RepID=A0A218Y0V4_PUNGR|nr:hypothetical protein CDL15_Pgr020995 [Punica granatum]